MFGCWNGPSANIPQRLTQRGTLSRRRSTRRANWPAGLPGCRVSGEDAPDLVATAPITSRQILWAKVEAVIGMIAFVFAPIVAVLTLDAVFAGVVCGLGILSAAAAATAIQLCFRMQARRSQFRRRQTSSRLATFAGAFSSIALGGNDGIGGFRRPGLQSAPRRSPLAFSVPSG